MVALSATEQSLFNNLRATLMVSRKETVELNDYYENQHKLEQLGLAIPEELKHFTVAVNWPRVTVDAIEQRLDVTGFRMPGVDAADKALRDVWEYNNMRERSGFAHIDALALKRSYVCVSTNDEDPDMPLISVESPNEMIAVRDPRTHRITAALRLYGKTTFGNDQRATLYLPNRTMWLRGDINGKWENEFDPDEHNLGSAPVVGMVNRNRATRPTGSIVEGVSEMADVIPLADSASRALTNAQLAQETVSTPQKYALGMAASDFTDPKTGEMVAKWDAYFGSVWASANKDATIGQLASADLANFETMINVYARQASALTFLPIEYFGLNTQQPPSADGQRAGEARLIKKAERRQTSFGASWESVNRLVLRFRDGDWNKDAERIETLWRDAGTPTQAQVTDAVVKEYQSGLTDWETAQESLGRSPETIARMKTRRQADSALATGFGVQAAIDNDGA
jgi:hypothetical protein